MRTECLALGDSSTVIEVKIRFLHMVKSPEDWQQGVEREVCAGPRTFKSIASLPLTQHFTFESDSEILEGECELSALPIAGDLFKISLSVRNLARLGGATVEAADATRDR